MRPIRVLVANQPRLMRELVMATIADHSDIEIVGEVEHESEIAAAVEKSQPDFLIIALGRSRRLPAVCEAILQDHPRIKVLAVPPARTNFVMFYWTSSRVQSNRIEASEVGILGAIRGKAQPAERVQ
jgi:DNA-binding NarL/FixJ family response regulator